MSLVDDYTSRPDALAVLRGLIDLLANPKATRELLDKLAEAHAKANEERATQGRAGRGPRRDGRRAGTSSPCSGARAPSA